MASSTLEHDDIAPPVVSKGHGTAVLGPSDSSDSGSDIQGGPGLNRDDGLTPTSGNTSDQDIDGPDTTAGADIGDANLDSDSDRNGTGERSAAGRDSTLATDTVLRDEHDEVIDGSSVGDEMDADLPTADELIGSEAEREDIDADANVPPTTSYRPAQVGQDTRNPPPSGTRTPNEPREVDSARALGKHVHSPHVPLYDRSGREERITHGK
jgi:hypothetical protein